jgi:hypothetical protein
LSTPRPGMRWSIPLGGRVDKYPGHGRPRRPVGRGRVQPVNCPPRSRSRRGRFRGGPQVARPDAQALRPVAPGRSLRFKARYGTTMYADRRCPARSRRTKRRRHFDPSPKSTWNEHSAGSLLLGRPQDNWHSVFCGHGHDIVDCSGRAVITPPGEAVPDHAGRGQITGHLSPLATSPALVEE